MTALEKLIEHYTEQLQILKDRRAEECDINNDDQNYAADTQINMVAKFVRDLKSLN